MQTRWYCYDKSEKDFLIILSIIIVIALLYAAFVYVLSNIGLGGAGDWSFDKIPGNYEIWRMNGKDVSLIKMFSDCSGGRKSPGPVYSLLLLGSGICRAADRSPL